MEPQRDNAHPRASAWPWLLIAAVIAVLDQSTKYAVNRLFEYGESVPVTSFFNLVLAYNPGAAFSFLAGAGGWQRWFFTGIAVVAIGVILYLLRKNAGLRLFSCALALILGGAIGNLIDRTIYGHVIDFLDFHVAGWHWPAFNIADMAIVCGAILFIVDELFGNRKS